MSGLRGALVTFALLLAPALAQADDFGPPDDVGAVRSDARILLAHRARSAKIDPKQVAVSDVVVSGDQAILSWDIGNQHGLMGLMRDENRWWDALDVATEGTTESDCWAIARAYPLSATTPMGEGAPSRAMLVAAGLSRALASAAASHNAFVRAADLRSERAHLAPGQPAKPLCEDDIYDVKPDSSVHRSGGTSASDRSRTSGYLFALHYAANDAQPNASFEEIRIRPPTHAEFLPYPTPYRFSSDAVMFFDFGVDGAEAVSFQRGSFIDVWFPFVLDDKLKYSMTFSGGSTSVGPVTGSIFDNVLHFDLPAFTAVPGQTLMGEIDGDMH